MCKALLTSFFLTPRCLADTRWFAFCYQQAVRVWHMHGTHTKQQATHNHASPLCDTHTHTQCSHRTQLSVTSLFAAAALFLIRSSWEKHLVTQGAQDNKYKETPEQQITQSDTSCTTSIYVKGSAERCLCHVKVFCLLQCFTCYLINFSCINIKLNQNWNDYNIIAQNYLKKTQFIDPYCFLSHAMCVCDYIIWV